MSVVDREWLDGSVAVRQAGGRAGRLVGSDGRVRKVLDPILLAGSIL